MRASAASTTHRRGGSQWSTARNDDAEKIALDHKKASDIDIAKILAVPQAAQFAGAMQHTFKAIGAEIRRRIVNP